MGGTHQGRSSTAQGPQLAGMTAGATAGSARLPSGRQPPRPWRWVKTALGGQRPAAEMLPPLRSDSGNPQPKAKRSTAARRYGSVTCAALTSLPLRHVGVRDWPRLPLPLGLRLFEGGVRQGAVAWAESRLRLACCV